jgi:hypothetical protein
MISAHDPENLKQLHTLYPELSDTELAEAAERLDAYLEVIISISERTGVTKDAIVSNETPSTMKPTNNSIEL